MSSHAQTTLDAINALIEKRATTDHQSYSVGNGISVTRLTIAELLEWQKVYENKVRLEEKAAAVAAGTPRRNKIQTRF